MDIFATSDNLDAVMTERSQREVGEAIERAGDSALIERNYFYDCGLLLQSL
jgi:hypothetical protein